MLHALHLVSSHRNKDSQPHITEQNRKYSKCTYSKLKNQRSAHHIIWHFSGYSLYNKDNIHNMPKKKKKTNLIPTKPKNKLGDNATAEHHVSPSTIFNLGKDKEAVRNIIT